MTTTIARRFTLPFVEYTQSMAFRMAFRASSGLIIAYSLAIYWDWSKPYWAGMSVLFCSLATAGSSVKACVDRVIGTALAFIASLAIIALFPQDRWMYLLAMSATIGVATYLQSGSRFYANIWFNLGFNIPIICLIAEILGVVGPSSFDIAVTRFLETALGALVIGVLAFFLWPGQGDKDFLATASSVTETQKKLITASIASRGKISDIDVVNKLSTQLSSTTAKLPPDLYAAAYDSDDINAIRSTWLRFIETEVALNTAIYKWQQYVSEIESLSLGDYIENIDEFSQSLIDCVDKVQLLVNDVKPEQELHVTSPNLNKEAISALSPFKRTAVICCYDVLQDISCTAQTLYSTATNIYHRKSIEKKREKTLYLPISAGSPVIDIDRLVAVQRQIFTLVSASLIVIFIPSVPNFVAVITLSNAFAMMSSVTPQIPARVALKPALFGLVITGVVYMTILPMLEGYLEFAAVLFITCFVMSYVTFNPHNPLPRLLSTVMMICIITGDNPPTYSFSHWIDWIIAVVLFYLISSFTWRFPVSFQPHSQLQWQYKRLLNSSKKLLVIASKKPKFWRTWNWRFHMHEISVLPGRLEKWIHVLSDKERGQTPTGSYEMLAVKLRTFSERLHQFLLLCTKLQHRHPTFDMQKAMNPICGDTGVTMIDALQSLLTQLVRDPAQIDTASCREHLSNADSALNALLDEIKIQSDDQSAWSSEAKYDLYLLLGSYRYLLKATEQLMLVVENIDWGCLHEERF